MKKVFLFLIAFLLAAAVFGYGQSETPDGEYVPDTFAFSGGTGKVSITCPLITMRGGQAFARIVFSSRNYTTVRIGGDSYAAEYTDEGAVFTLPASLNRAFSIFATTTAMSKPHEIEYRLYIGLGSDTPAGLKWSGSMSLSYAEGFCADYYEGGYALITVGGEERYLLVSEGMETPEGLDPGIVVLQKPLDSIYLAATSAMSLFDAIGALDHIRLSGTQEDGWYVENAVKAMRDGDILFAGKYSSPDFELLIRENCDLAVESMMILHAPQVRELIQLLGIPVFIDRSSSEPHPLGRLEWIKLYGLLTEHEDEAEAVFREQTARVESLDTVKDSGKTVAFFSVKPDGSVTVRGSQDYIVCSIELAGGHYVFDSIKGQETNASVNIAMEDFYISAMDADYLIYNSAIEAPVDSIDSLISQQRLLADFKAVKSGNVYCTEPSLYQSSDKIGTFIEDLGKMFSGEIGSMTFLYKLS